MNQTGIHEERQDKATLFYGWIIVVAVTIIYTISEIPVFAFGIFVKPIQNELGWTREVITRAFGLYMILLGIFSILGGILVDRIGPKILNCLGGILIGLGFIIGSRAHSVVMFYLGYGILGGIGFAFIFVPNQTTLARWFIEKKGLALGIMFAGGGIGTLIATPLMQAGIERYGWRTVFVILGILILCVSVPAALFLKKDPEEMGLSPLGKGDMKSSGATEGKGAVKSGQMIQAQNFTLPEALKTVSFWIYNLAITLMFLGFFMAQVNMVPHVTDKGVAAAAAALALGIASAFNALGRLLMGAVSDKIGTKNSFYICLSVGAIMLFYLISVHTPWMMYLFVVFFGVAYGGSVPQMPRMVSELFGVKAMGAIMGVSMLITTLGPALGPVLGGAIYDRTGSYSPAFLTGGGAILVALILIYLLRAPKKSEG
ncbi:putative Major facilitator superfamily protein [uncultured Desulfobacterium sp.]|uniref:Putative Major facilitator superfamily protein n=1 Tax=uncultured Desulfobacterium sp. TaxID=201089 RepID=A0A445MVI4_9BACT|nr:putative Major facilitator superfamily protein [uncultured Desulfobacterium sp.]